MLRELRVGDRYELNPHFRVKILAIDLKRHSVLGLWQQGSFPPYQQLNSFDYMNYARTHWKLLNLQVLTFRRVRD